MVKNIVELFRSTNSQSLFLRKNTKQLAKTRFPLNQKQNIPMLPQENRLTILVTQTNKIHQFIILLVNILMAGVCPDVDHQKEKRKTRFLNTSEQFVKPNLNFLRRAKEKRLNCIHRRVSRN
jgi:hypothetical protein